MKIWFIEKLKGRWSEEAGYRDFLKLAFPLILSTGTWTIQHFVNRVFLTWYSPTAIAASMPAGMLSFALIALFLGTVTYVDVFVAQYYGAKQYRKIGPALWQGVYLSIAGGLLILSTLPAAEPVFKFIGHDPAIRHDEIIYYKYLAAASFAPLLSSVLSGFYSGRGKTWTLVIVNIITITINIIIDNILIFGKMGFKPMGIEGSGIATAVSSSVSFLIYLFLITRSGYEKEYATRSGWRPDLALIKRILRYGFPSGVHFFLDMSGFTIFILIMGTLGTVPLAATNIAFNISTLSFMPMLGCAIAVSILVGQNLGANRPEIAQKSVWSGFQLTFTYMLIIACLYLAAPSVFVGAFAAHANAESFAEIGLLVTILLRFVALYSLFDAMNIIFAAAIKGAGDTHFVMRFIVTASVVVLIIPSYIALEIFNLGIFSGWSIASFYIAVLGIVFFVRFLGGKWKSMRVIERTVPVIPPGLPEDPSAEFPAVVP
ncbi:MAG: MATE family efflux transporter [Spirochaetota bacterium]